MLVDSFLSFYLKYKLCNIICWFAKGVSGQMLMLFRGHGVEKLENPWPSTDTMRIGCLLFCFCQFVAVLFKSRSRNRSSSDRA